MGTQTRRPPGHRSVDAAQLRFSFLDCADDCFIDEHTREVDRLGLTRARAALAASRLAATGIDCDDRSATQH